MFFVSLTFCLVPRPATALCLPCSQEYVSLLFEQAGAADGLAQTEARIAALDAEIQPLMSSIESLESQINNTVDESQRQSYEQEKAALVAQASPLLQERNSLQGSLDQQNMNIAAIGGSLAAYGSTCEHEVQCSQCGYLQLGMCICSAVTCDRCNQLITQCDCDDVTYCPACGFDSRYCGCGNPFEP